MRRRFVSRGVIAAAIVGLVALGCASSGRDGADADMASDQQDWSQGSEGLDDDESMRGVPVSVPELSTVYFDYDQSSIRGDQRPVLQGNADAIRNHPEWRTIILEGHADERGSEEYNLALAERRAESVKRYLTNLGIEGGKVDTVSFGESKPVAFGHDESAWRLNRRVEFRVIR